MTTELVALRGTGTNTEWLRWVIMGGRRSHLNVKSPRVQGLRYVAKYCRRWFL